MIQGLLSLVVIASLVSLAVAAWRLATGVDAQLVGSQVVRTALSAGVVTVVSCSILALAPDRFLTPGVGLLQVGLTPTVIADQRAVRIALLLLAAVGMAWSAGALRVRGQASRLLGAVARDLQAFAAQLRDDWRAMATDPESRALIPALVALTVCGAAARAYAARLPVSYDESTTVVWFASRSPIDILTDYGIPNNHILHTLLVHLSRQLFGFGLIGARLPAILAGILIIPVSGWIGWKQFGGSVAIVLAALVTAFPPLLEYAAQARGYTLAALLVAAAFLALLYALERPTRTAWVLYVVCAALSLFTTTTSMMGLYFMGGWLLFLPGRRWVQVWTAAGYTMIAGALTAALYVPTIAYSGLQSLLSNTALVRVPLREIPSRLLPLIGELKRCWGGGLPDLVTAGLLLLTVLSLVRRSKGAYRSAPLLAGFAVMCAITLLGNRVIPFARSFIVVLPLVVGATAVGVAALLTPLTRWHRLALPTAAVVLSVAWMFGREARESRLVASWARSGASDAGGDSIHCCTEGYYPDAEAVAVWARRTTSLKVPIVVHAWAGMGETIRFYLLRERLSIMRLHRFDHRAGFAQLDGYDSVYVLMRGAPRSQDPMTVAAAALRLPAEQVSALFTAHRVDAGLVNTAVVTLVPRPGAAPLIASSGQPIDRLDYPR